MGRRMEPIKDTRTVNRITDILEAREDAYGRRLFALWYIGINMGLRIGDMLALRVKDLRDAEYYYLEPAKQRHLREYWERKNAKENNRPVRELRPNKVRYVVPAGVRRMMRDRFKDAPGEMPIFASKRKTPGGKVKPISRQEAVHDMHRISEIAGLDFVMGCHTMRKTFGYQRYKESNDVRFLLEWFQHSSVDITLEYIGVQGDSFEQRIDRSATDTYGKNFMARH